MNNPNTKYEVVYFWRHIYLGQRIGLFPSFDEAQQASSRLITIISNLPRSHPAHFDADGLCWMTGRPRDDISHPYMEAYYQRDGIPLFAPNAFRVRPVEVE